MQRLSLLDLWKREFGHYTAGIFRQDLLAGLTIAAVALPLALAFGVASGASAPAGLVTAILGGLIIGALSGAPYQISGPTGAMSAVLMLAGVHAKVMYMLQRAGADALIGKENFFWSADRAILVAEQRHLHLPQDQQGDEVEVEVEPNRSQCPCRAGHGTGPRAA